MAKVRVKQGHEGPLHDPYGYVEVEFTKTDGTVVLCHIGLAEWVRVDGGKLYDHEIVDDVETTFKRLTGMSFTKATMIPYILEDRMLKRMTKKQQISYFICVAADLQLLRYAN